MLRGRRSSRTAARPRGRSPPARPASCAASTSCGARGAGEHDRVERLDAVRAPGPRARPRSVARSRVVGRAHLVGVHAHVEPREVQPEDRDRAAAAPPAGRRRCARRGGARRLASTRSRSAASSAASRVARLVAAGELVVEPPPDRRQLAPVRLVRVAHRGLGVHPRQLRARPRSIEARSASSTLARACPRRRARAPARAPRRGSARSASVRGAAERVADLVRASRSGCRPGRRRSTCRTAAAARRARAAPRRAARRGRPPTSSRLASKNHSPWRISSSTLGRIERTSSVCHSIVVSSATARSAARRSSGAARGSSSSFEQPAEPQLALQVGAARGLGRVRRQHRLEPHARRRARAARSSETPAARIAAIAWPSGSRALRAARRLEAQPADAVVLLGEVDEQEVERERAHDEALLALAELADGLAAAPRARARPSARAPRGRAGGCARPPRAARGPPARRSSRRACSRAGRRRAAAARAGRSTDIGYPRLRAATARVRNGTTSGPGASSSTIARRLGEVRVALVRRQHVDARQRSREVDERVVREHLVVRLAPPRTARRRARSPRARGASAGPAPARARRDARALVDLVRARAPRPCATRCSRRRARRPDAARARSPRARAPGRNQWNASPTVTRSTDASSSGIASARPSRTSTPSGTACWNAARIDGDGSIATIDCACGSSTRVSLPVPAARSATSPILVDTRRAAAPSARP